MPTNSLAVHTECTVLHNLIYAEQEEQQKK